MKPLAGKKVVLRVTFEANGEIGAISVISGLSDNLTEEAIEAAKAIKFEPATRNGAAISVTKPVEYNFTIY
ncbi:MAG TPA: TonB family protein [Pyrinomonadaceae bacterium]